MCAFFFVWLVLFGFAVLFILFLCVLMYVLLLFGCCLFVFVFVVFCCFVKAAKIEELNRKLRKQRWYNQQRVLGSAYVIVFVLLFCFVVLCCCFVLVV